MSGVVLECFYIPWFSTVTDVPERVMNFQLWMYKSILEWRTNSEKDLKMKTTW